MVLATGLTLRVAGLLATPLCTTPSDQVTVHGPVPVNAAWMFAELPLHIVPPPLTLAVGWALTVTVALPLKVPAVQPVESDNAVTV